MHSSLKSLLSSACNYERENSFIDKAVHVVERETLIQEDVYSQRRTQGEALFIRAETLHRGNEVIFYECSKRYEGR